MSNKGLLKALSKIQREAQINGEVYKEKAYRKAIYELSKIDFKINKKSLPKLKKMKIPGIGAGIMEKIENYVLGIKIAKTTTKGMDDLSKILGVGPSTIAAWGKLGIRTLSDLRKNVARGKVKLNNMQMYGLRFYSDLNERIPRDEVTALGDQVKGQFLRLDPYIIFTIAGSYRRGAKTSGDIDILVSNKEHFDETLLQSFLEFLHDDPNFVAIISSGIERITYLYKSPISGKVRQIDVLHLAYAQYWSGILYFTGSWSFNEAMRGYAKKKGYRLNQNGLFMIKNNKQVLIHANSEAEIFKLLGLKYIPPELRESADAVKEISGGFEF